MNGDQNLRQQEHDAAATGDPAALARLRRERCRRGEHFNAGLGRCLFCCAPLRLSHDEQAMLYSFAAWATLRQERRP